MKRNLLLSHFSLLTAKSEKWGTMPPRSAALGGHAAALHVYGWMAVSLWGTTPLESRPLISPRVTRCLFSGTRVGASRDKRKENKWHAFLFSRRIFLHHTPTFNLIRPINWSISSQSLILSILKKRAYEIEIQSKMGEIQTASGSSRKLQSGWGQKVKVNMGPSFGVSIM